MSGHFELGEIIKNHKDSDVGKISFQTLFEGAMKCYSSQHQLFFLPSWIYNVFFPHNPPSFLLTIYLISPSISSLHIKPHWPSSLLLTRHLWTFTCKLHLQCPFWNRQSMFPSGKTAPILCLYPHFIPTPYCVLTAITACLSLTLWPSPIGLQQIPTQYRYWWPLGGCSSAFSDFYL